MSTVQSQSTERYGIDPVHTSVAFSIRHLMIAKVRGRFASVTGTIEIPAGADVPSAVDVSIESASIDTREPQRDDHLRSADFLDAATYPEITFRSTAITGEASAFKIHGDLTIHGTTRPVVLDATFEGRATDPWGNPRAGFEAHATISRKDFDLNWNQALETGGVVVGDEVRIELNVEAILAK